MLATSPPQKKPFNEQVALFMSGTVGAFAVVFFMIVISPLFGALSGFTLSILMPNWICGGFTALGLNVHPGDLYKIGAALAWVGGYLRYSPNTPKAKK